MRPQQLPSHERPGGTNVHIYPSPLTYQSRMNRITESIDRLGLFDAVWTVGVRQNELAENERLSERRRFIRLRVPQFKFKVINTLYWSCLVFWRLWRVRVTCVNCHSLPALPVCVLIAFVKRAKLVYDTHELETETYYCRGLRKTLSKVGERILIHFAGEVCVVTQSIADWYAQAYGLKRVWLVKNVPSDPRSCVATSRVLRTLHCVPPDALLFIYQGLVNSERGCDRLLAAFANASDKRHLIVMGDGPGAPLAKQYAQMHSNIHYQPAVPMDQVLHYTASADVGLFLLPLDSCLSYQYSLANKFFEYLSAGLAVVVSDNPEMAAIVRQHDCGWVYYDDQKDFAQFVNRMTQDEVDNKRLRAREAASNYTWECEEIALREMYENLFNLCIRAHGPDACAAA